MFGIGDATAHHSLYNWDCFYVCAALVWNVVILFPY